MPERTCRLSFAALPIIAGALLASACTDFTPTDPPRVTDAVPAHFALVDRQTNSSLLVAQNGRFANLVVIEPHYQMYSTGVWRTQYAIELTKRVLQGRFADVFDFVIFTFDPDRPRTDLPVGQNSTVSRSAEGLGFPDYTPHEAWGGDTKLRSVVMLREVRNLRGGPSLHELAHQWGATLIRSVDYLHWGLAGVGGQLGGWVTGSLEVLEPGLYRGFGPTGAPFHIIANYGNRVPYAPLELYMMGFLPPDSVPPVEVAVGGEVVDALAGTFRADSIAMITIDDIIRNFGPRRPAWPDAPRQFRALYVVLSTEPLDEEEVAALSHDVDQFTLAGPDDRDDVFNFWEATRGQATIRFDGLLEAREERGAPDA